MGSIHYVHVCVEYMNRKCTLCSCLWGIHEWEVYPMGKCGISSAVVLAQIVLLGSTIDRMHYRDFLALFT